MQILQMGKEKTSKRQRNNRQGSKRAKSQEAISSKKIIQIISITQNPYSIHLLQVLCHKPIIVRRLWFCFVMHTDGIAEAFAVFYKFAGEFFRKGKQADSAVPFYFGDIIFSFDKSIEKLPAVNYRNKGGAFDSIIFNHTVFFQFINVSGDGYIILHIIFFLKNYFYRRLRVFIF